MLVKVKQDWPVQVVINPNTTIALTSGDVNQTVLNGIDITDIVYTITNGTGATVTGLPNGVIATYLAGTLTISGTPTENGTFNYSIYGTGTCASSSVLTGTITVNDCVMDGQIYNGLETELSILVIFMVFMHRFGLTV
jgi:hypothetical protein